MNEEELSRLLHQDVVRWIKKRHGDPQWARKIQRSVSSHVVATHGHGYMYVDAQTKKRRTLRGLTTWMDTLSRASNLPVERFSPSSAPRMHGPLGGLTGTARGSLVHRQVEDLVNLDLGSFRHVHRQGEHPWAHDALEAMVTGYHWRPVRAEFVVHSLKHNIASSIDLIMCDRRGRLIVVELKTGYTDGAFDRNMSRRVWNPSWLRDAGVPKTPFGDAMVQVMVGAELLRRRWRVPYTMLRLYVVRVDQAGVEFNRVPTSLFRSLAPQFMARLRPKRRMVGKYHH